MKSTSRRDFLKKSFLASASALAVPSLLNSCKDVETSAEKDIPVLQKDEKNHLIVPKKMVFLLREHFWMKYLMIYLIRIGEKQNGIWIFNI